MNITHKGEYRSQKGNTVFRYAVSGNKKQLEAFKQAQGDFYREDDDGNPMWFTTRFVGKTGKLIITSKGRIVPDMSAFEQANSLAKQYGGDLGQELAKTAAATLLGGKRTETENPVEVPTSVEQPGE